MIFYSVCEAELFEPSITRQGLEDIKSKGFDSIYLEYRNVKTPHGSPVFTKAIENICNICKELDIKIGLDAHMISPSHTHRPETYTDDLQFHHFDLQDGRFDWQTGGEFEHLQIEGAWIIEGQGQKLSRVTDVLDDVEFISAHNTGGGCAMTEVRGAMKCFRKYRIKGQTSGRLFLLARNKYRYSFRDLGHPNTKELLHESCDYWKQFDVEGYVWDEPHYGFAFFPNNGRPIHQRLYDEYQKQFGEDLKSNLIDLWYDVPHRNSALTRLQYAELLEQGTASLEEEFYNIAQKRFPALSGKKVPYHGIHRTMHEELSDDFFIGCVDYFRHGKFMSDGFTDSVFERDDSMVCMFHMARSLAEVSDNGEAWSNNWGFNPTEKHHAYYLPLMAAMGIRWNGHTYHSSIQFGPGYPHSPLWDTMAEHLKNHREVIDKLDGAQRVADTAIVYNWSSLATHTDACIHNHRRNLMLLSRQLTRSAEQFMFISNEMLAEASIDGNHLLCGDQSYAKLILPDADFLDEAAFAKLEEAKAAGVQIVIFGTALNTSREGQDLSQRFLSLVGASAIENDVDAGIHEGDIVIHSQGHQESLNCSALQHNYYSNPKSTYAHRFKAQQVSAKNGDSLCTWSGRPLSSKDGSVSYYGFDLPHFPQLTNLALDLTPSEFFIFKYRKGADTIISGVREWGTPFSGKLELAEGKLELKNCHVFVAKASDGQLSLI